MRTILTVVYGWGFAYTQTKAFTKAFDSKDDAELLGAYRSYIAMLLLYVGLYFVIFVFFRRPLENRDIRSMSLLNFRRAIRLAAPEGRTSRMCILCYERPANAMCKPCRHASTCEECLLTVARGRGAHCPLCRQGVDAYDVVTNGQGFFATYVEASDEVGDTIIESKVDAQDGPSYNEAYRHHDMYMETVIDAQEFPTAGHAEAWGDHRHHDMGGWYMDV